MLNQPMRRFAAALAAMLAFAGMAVAQVPPPNLPASTVWGRLGIGSGPGQAIPFATLNTQLLRSLCTTSGAFPIYNATTGLWVCSTAGGTGSVANLTGGPLTINPTTGTFTQGVAVNQVGPTGTGITTGPVRFNQFVGSYGSTVTCADNTNPFADNGWWCNAVSLLGARLTVGGLNLTSGSGALGGTIAALSGHIIFNSASNSPGENDKVGIGGIAYATAVDSSVSGLYGGFAQSVIDSGGSFDHQTGFEIDMATLGTGVARKYRSGLNIVNQGTKQAATANDGAILIASGNIAGSFQRFATLSGIGATAPLTATADLFVSDIAMTVANVFNFAGACSGAAPAQGPCNVTVTGNILNFPNVTLGGNGNLATSGTITVTINQNVTSPITVINNSTGTTAAAGFLAENSNGAAGAGFFGITSTGFTPIGAETANVVAMRALSSASGIVIQTDGNVPIIMAVNSAEVARVAAGVVTVTGNQNSVSGLVTTNNSAGTGAASAYLAENGTNIGVFGITGTAFTTVGALAANTVEVRGLTGVAGITIQTDANVPIIIAVNSVEVGRFAATGETITANSNTATGLVTLNNSSGVNAASVYLAENGTGIGVFGITGTSFTTVGATAANMVEVRGLSGVAGIAIQTDGNVPIIFATNSTERMRLLAGLAVGLTTDPGAGIVSALTGYRINNAATSAHYLRGNGTNYVDSAIVNTDLPNVNYFSGAATSGGVAYFSSTTQIASSGLMTLNGVMYGGGAGNPPLSTAQGAANSILIANAGAPSFSQTPVIQTSLSVGGVAPNNATMLITGNATQVSGSLFDAVVPMLQLLAANNVQTSLVLQTYGTAGPSEFIGGRARGTAASPTTLTANDLVFSYAGYGYDGANWDLAGALTFIATAITANTNISAGIRLITVNTGALKFGWFTPQGGLMMQNIATYSSTNDPGAEAIYANAFIQANTYLQAGTKLRATGSAPALTSCGTSPAIEGSDLSGTVTMGTGSPTGCVITFNAAYTGAPRCTVSWRVNIASMQYAVSTTAITLTQTATSSNVVDYICTVRSGGWLLKRDLDPAANDNTPAFMDQAA